MPLSDWRRKKLDEFGVSHFYYFSLIGNLQSVLQYDLLPKNEIISRGISAESFAEETVQDRRHMRSIELSNHTYATIHDMVPLYLVPRTPTLSARRERQHEIFFLVISVDVVTDAETEFAFTDGNAASQDTKIFLGLYKLSSIPWDVLRSNYWTEFADGKRKRNAEFLIYPSVHPRHFKQIIVINDRARDYCTSHIQTIGESIAVTIDPTYFFV